MPKCKKCKLILDDSCFSTNDYNGKYRTRCKNCRKLYNKIWYEKNKVKQKKRARVNALKYKNEAREFAKHIYAKGCSLCGEKCKECLDFHHLDVSKKEYNASEGLNGFISVETFKKEIKKCILVCANCHRKIHAGIISCSHIPSLS